MLINVRSFPARSYYQAELYGYRVGVLSLDAAKDAQVLAGIGFVAYIQGLDLNCYVMPLDIIVQSGGPCLCRRVIAVRLAGIVAYCRLQLAGAYFAGKQVAGIPLI